jgi:hypothetical protein
LQEADGAGSDAEQLKALTALLVLNPASAFKGLLPTSRSQFARNPSRAMSRLQPAIRPSRRDAPVMSKSDELTLAQQVQRVVLAFALAAFTLVPTVGQVGVSPAFADGDTASFKFPPIDRTSKDRCKWVSSAMGQANAARDKLYDLRECKMAETNAEGVDISGALLARGDFSKTNFKEAQLSKVYAEGAKFDGADFTNGVLDRGYYKDASFRGTIFTNAVLSSSSFENADLTDADFTEAYIGMFDQRKLCKNPTLKGENPVTGIPTRASAGCP